MLVSSDSIVALALLLLPNYRSANIDFLTTELIEKTNPYMSWIKLVEEENETAAVIYKAQTTKATVDCEMLQ